ncbi:hypothetical protein [Streptomyces sp. NPDC002156]
MRAFHDLKWSVEDIRAEADTVAIRYTMTGAHHSRRHVRVPRRPRAVHPANEEEQDIPWQRI